ncbi:MAG: hypothetical protein VX258_04625 [Pseudomonadota bacterium]|nr:hypothetical protein [Pseudomonadota bacterium]
MSLTPLSWRLLFKAIHRHLVFFLIFFLLGGVSVAVGVVLFLYVDAGIVGPGFCVLMGGGAMMIGVWTSFSSIGYYYERALLKEHGRNVDGQVVSLSQLTDGEHEDEPLWAVAFAYQVDGQRYESEAVLPNLAWVDNLQAAQWLPLRMLKPRPEVAEPRWRKMKNHLKREGQWQAPAAQEG